MKAVLKRCETLKPKKIITLGVRFLKQKCAQPGKGVIRHRHGTSAPGVTYSSNASWLLHITCSDDYMVSYKWGKLSVRIIFQVFYGTEWGLCTVIVCFFNVIFSLTQDSVEAIRYYILSMFKSAGMKILLLDKETMPIISLVSSRHELLDHQGLLVFKRRCLK